MLFVITVDFLKKNTIIIRIICRIKKKHQRNNAELYVCLSQDEAAQVKGEKKDNTEEGTTVEGVSVE